MHGVGYFFLVDESGPRAFPSTRWSLIVDVDASDAQVRRDAMEGLLAAYWKPLYHFVRRKGADPQLAQDLVQGFAERLLTRDAMSGLDPARGRLRAYLRTAISNYMINEHEKRSAAKRGGLVQKVDFDRAESELEAVSSDPEAAFNHSWARELMNRSLTRLADEYRDGQRAGSVEALQRLFGGTEGKTHAQLAAELDMTETKLTSFLRRARVRFREILTEEIADTVVHTDADALQSELAEITRLITG